MKKRQVLGIFVISMIVAGIGLPPESFAKPKRLYNGCTAEQIQTNFGNSCVNQMEQDIIGNKPYMHALLCNGGDVQCCTYDNKTGQILTCRKPAGTRVMPGRKGTNIGAAGMAGVQSRSVEGEASTEEEGPPPAWMTEERMKQLRKDAQAE